MRSSTQITLAALLLIATCLGVDRFLMSPAFAAGESASADGASDKASTNEKEAAEETKKIRLAHIVVKGELPESPGQLFLFGDLGTDLRKTIARFDQVVEDDKVQGLVIDIRTQLPRGKLEELRAAVKRVRASGKKVYAQIENSIGSQYLLASACDEIIMPESGMILVPGIHAEFGYYKDLLKKLGIEADMMHVGDAKGAAEPLMRRSMSEPVKKNMTALLDDIYDQMITQIAADRNLKVEDVQELVDEGLMMPTEAKKAGLIDRVEYADAFRAQLTKEYDADKLVYVLNYAKKKVDTDFSGPMGMMKLFQALMGGDTSESGGKGPKIAVVYAVGPIMTGESENDGFGTQTIGSDTLVKALKKAADDETVKAVVLRVNSPGGSSLASDLIWRATKTVGKPIVASMGDVAASGGYYISMGCDRILAEPGTITGSIGVVGGKLDMSELYDNIGIATDTISRGKNSGIFSSNSKFSESERDAIMATMEDVYQQFTSKAATGRHMELDKLKELAGGKVYTGRVAKRLGLIDEVGTLKDAIALAKQLAGLGASEKAELLILPEVKNPLDELFGIETDEEKEVRLLLGLRHFAPELTQPLLRALEFQRVMQEPVAVMMPYWIEIK